MKLTPAQLLSLSSYFNTCADLPVDIQAIADTLKETLTPTVGDEPAPSHVAEDVPAPTDEPAPVEDAPAPADEPLA